jgi:PTS system glucitol/sorbitol-specific IIA component
MKVLFEVTASQIGELVAAFKEQKLLILFDENAPKELHDITVLHTNRKNNGEIKQNDILMIDEQAFRIHFVGDTANKTIQELGHVTLKFDGSPEDLPGTICVEDKPIPDVQVGSRIQIVRNE